MTEQEERQFKERQDKIYVALFGNGGGFETSLIYRLLQVEKGVSEVQEQLMTAQNSFAEALESTTRNFEKSLADLEKNSNERVGRIETVIGRVNWLIVLTVVGGLLGLVIQK